MNLRIVLRMLFAVVAGVTLEGLGLTLGMWQLWLLIIVLVASGINEGKK